MLLSSVSTCEFQHFVMFMIRKETMILFLWIAQDWMRLYVVLLWILKASVVKCIIRMFSHKNNIIISFLIIKMTKCWNSHVNTLDNNNYKYLAKLQHVSSLVERVRQNQSNPFTMNSFLLVISFNYFKFSTNLNIYICCAICHYSQLPQF